VVYDVGLNFRLYLLTPFTWGYIMLYSNVNVNCELNSVVCVKQILTFNPLVTNIEI